MNSTLPVLAGIVSTIIFASSTLPMLRKAAATKDLASYSLGNIALANVGNLVHSIYVFSLPVGPIWALHSFYLVSTALMLFWYLRYSVIGVLVQCRGPPPAEARPPHQQPAGNTLRRDGHHRSGPGRPVHRLPPAATRREFIIIEGNDRVGDGWRRQWDTLRLYTPAKYDGLPGMPFPGSPWLYPLKDEVADYLEAYANRFGLPIRWGRVERVEPSEMATSCAPMTADGSRPATSSLRPARSAGPRAFRTSPRSSPEIRQLHSSEYRRPDQLRDGPVLVVGASHSGTDVAYEVAPSHPTLCGPDRGQIPVER